MSAAARGRLESIPIDSALEPGARNAVVECLGVRDGERVLIICDPGSEAIAAAILHVAIGVGAQVDACIVSPSDAASGAFVARLMQRLVDTNVSVVVSQLDGIPPALRRRIVSEEIDNRRHGHMAGITRAMMEQSMRADYAEVDRLSRRVAERLRPGASIEVHAPGGTELVVRLDPSCVVHAASGVQASAGWTNLPGGEVFGVPATVDGTLVADGGVWLADGSELATAFRLRLTLEGGRVTHIDGTPEVAARLGAALDADEGARRVGQVGLGTNTGVLAPIGALLQDLKLPGVHFALGHTCPEITRARFDSAVEIPLLVRRASATIDGEPLLVAGRYAPALLD
ncbi:MAG: aminopeptidase [Myxococcota bacterium]|nr:aminopeptidase [Myxococcota bacterium]